MKKIATVVGYLAWFVSQFLGTAILGILFGGREHLYGQTLMVMFVIHSILWGVMQIGLLHAKLDKLASGVEIVREDLCNLPRTDQVKW